MSAITHDNGFTHPWALQCGGCPGYPHRECVDRGIVDRLLALADEWEANPALNFSPRYVKDLRAAIDEVTA